MITVLHVITGLNSGGAEGMLSRVVTAKYRTDSSRQIVVSLMDEGVYGAKVQDAGVQLHCLRMRSGFSIPRSLIQLSALMRKLKPNVVMTWLYHADLLGTLAAALAGLGTDRVVWNVRCSNMDFSRYPRTTRWTVRLLAWLSPRPTAIAVNSDSGRRIHETLGYKPKKWVYLPNGFDLKECRPDESTRIIVRKQFNINDHTIMIGLVARVDPQKDHTTFLAAAERLTLDHQNLCFVLIGKDTEKLPLPPALSSHVLALGERRDVHELMRALDVLVLSSAYGEAFPNVLGEAMATGLPCVSTDVGDAAAIIGNTGLIVPPHDPNALAAAIADIINENSDARALRGQRARQRIQQEFNLERIINLYKNLWLSVSSKES